MNASLPKSQKAAAVLVVAGGLALTVLGWWIVGFEYRDDLGRFVDVTWWLHGAVRALGLLAFGKVGFKIALAVVGVVVAVGAKLRSRRGAREPQA
ncbi:hypothetical protein [Cryptosporangium phraense]|uniref:Uncharacterized protein n=1 Tax=Cryptosporangium phraense TaxID=2593070 RepID=A0A545AJ51_9ACTN|nr:hypothetical protein [Cryptosporangium phraense]TQS41354.1 hypothetical protein FL583_30065 [Cryptosporangium phraense]